MLQIGTAAAIGRSLMNNANWIVPSSATVTGAVRPRTTGASSIDSTLAAGIATAIAEPQIGVGRSESGLDSPAAQIQAQIQAGERPLERSRTSSQLRPGELRPHDFTHQKQIRE